MNLDQQFWITTVAVTLSPLIAVQVQKTLEEIKERRRRREDVFHTLMRTRVNRVSHEHVSALNRIDIEYYGRHFFGIHHRSSVETEICNAWKMYLDHLNIKAEDDTGISIWAVKGEEYFTDLLYLISKSLGYKFDKVMLRRSVYSPNAHVRIENEDEYIRQGILKLLRGESTFPIHVTNHPGENQIDTGKIPP